MLPEIPFKTPNFVRKLIPSAQFSVETNEKTIYLTFDDGPVPGLTENVLSILKDYDAKATFFCVGDNIRKHPHIFQKIIENQHAIGNHTQHHLKGWSVGKWRYLQNILQCENEIERHIQKPYKKLFRPPYGQFRADIHRELKKRDYKVVLWDLLSKDYDSGLQADKILKNCLRNTEKGTIVVFHDNYKAEKNLLKVLPNYLNHFHQLGFKFKEL